MSLPNNDEIKAKIGLIENDIYEHTNTTLGFFNGARWMRSLAEQELAKLREDAEKMKLYIKFLLTFAPKGEVPKGLAPMFYHTLDYEKEVELQNRINEIIMEIEHYKTS